MKRLSKKLATLGMFGSLFATAAALAGDAETSARASGGGWRRSGTATATARYEGHLGFARSDTRTGRLNLARGVAVGVDEDGVSLSLSTAIAPRLGPAFATNFNLSIGTDGSLSHSTSTSMALGGSSREVSAGGATTTRRGGSATSLASGRTRHGGVVHATTRSHNHRPRPHSGVRRVFRR